MNVHMRIVVHADTNTHTCTYIHTNMRLNAHTHVRTYICAYKHTCTHKQMKTYTTCQLSQNHKTQTGAPRQGKLVTRRVICSLDRLDVALHARRLQRATPHTRFLRLVCPRRYSAAQQPSQRHSRADQRCI